MGYQVENTFTGHTLQVHRFDTLELAERYVENRGFKFVKHVIFKPGAYGLQFFIGPRPGERVSIGLEHVSHDDGFRQFWRVNFWNQDEVCF